MAGESVTSTHFDKLTPLKIKNKLAPTPKHKPKYAMSVNGESLADPRATRALVALMNQHATIGGAACHWGGPAALAEIMSSLHTIMFRESKNQWYENYNFINDAGHTENGIYALRALWGHDNLTFSDLKKFRSIESKLTGHGEAHLNPEGVYISNGPLGSGVPQAQGLAVADKIIGNSRTTICVVSDGAAMEGEAKEAFAAIPGLAQKNKINPFVMIISDNNTKLSGRIDQDSFDMQKTFKSLEVLGWKIIKIEAGNDLAHVHPALDIAIKEAAKNPTQPICVIVKTVKGYSVAATEKSASGGHGYPLKAYDDTLTNFLQEIYKNEAPQEFLTWAEDILKQKPAPKAANPNAPKTDKVQGGLSRALIRAASEGLPVFSVTSDLPGSTGLAAFHQKFPGRFLDVGIAESNMISTAIGLSKQGLIPIVDTFAQFAITKGSLPLIMAGLSEGPVIGVFSHTGFQDAADGASHQATTYFAALSAIPHVKVINLSCASEAENLVYTAITKFKEKRDKGETPDSVIFFLGRENHPISFTEGATYPWKKAQVITHGTAATIVTSGVLLEKALKAAETLKKENIEITVINHPFVNIPDTETVSLALKKTHGKLITMEDHQLVCGQGAQLVHALIAKNIEIKKYVGLGIKGEFGQSAYTANELYHKHQIDEEALIKAVRSIL